MILQLNYLILFLAIILLFGCILFKKQNTTSSNIINNDKYNLSLVSNNDINNINMIKSIPLVEKINNMVESEIMMAQTNINKLKINEKISNINSNIKSNINSNIKSISTIKIPKTLNEIPMALSQIPKKLILSNKLSDENKPMIENQYDGSNIILLEKEIGNIRGKTYDIGSPWDEDPDICNSRNYSNMQLKRSSDQISTDNPKYHYMDMDTDLYPKDQNNSTITFY
jgi:hypothetical protein